MLHREVARQKLYVTCKYVNNENHLQGQSKEYSATLSIVGSLQV